jgi:Na+-translocating ferredoxin:NAD+ oxidoreductase subunit G
MGKQIKLQVYLWVSFFKTFHNILSSRASLVIICALKYKRQNMNKILFTLLLTLSSQLWAQVLISPIDAMKENYDLNATVMKKNVLLTKAKFQNIQKNAAAKLDTKIYRIYTATRADKVLGYGILINRKVRSKNTVVLYFIKDAILLNIEIIAFNEPLEYIPTKKWNSQFKNIKTDTMLQLNRDIPSVTGATMSARSVTDGSRIAFAIYNELLKGK